MLGVYNYTVWLTYLSVLCSAFGTLVGVSGGGHPWVAAACLVICAILDGFDGRVARSKKDRTLEEKKFGMELDSFADTLAFGVLPCALTYGMGRAYPHAARLDPYAWWIFYVVSSFYVLAVVIRLASFNVMDEQEPDPSAPRMFTGVPSTTAAFVFPELLVIQYILKDTFNLFPVSLALMLALGPMFLCKRIKIKKFTLRQVIIFSVLGLLEVILLAVLYLRGRPHA